MSAAATFCQRFEGEALESLVSDRPLSIELETHVAHCATCDHHHASYRRLLLDLRRVGSGESPPPDWKRNVRLQTLEHPTGAPPRAALDTDTVSRDVLRRFRRKPSRATQQKHQQQRTSWALLAATLAAAVVGLLLLRAPTEPSGPAPQPTLQLAVEAGATVHRGDTNSTDTGETSSPTPPTAAQPGDRLLLEARVQGHPYGELRVYRNDRELVLRCAGPPRCQLEGGRLRGTVDLDLPGRYQALILVSPDPLPMPGTSLDDDTARALREGATVEMGRRLLVR